MIELDHAAAALAVLVTQEAGHFRHLSTAWCVGDGEWVTALDAPEMPAGAVLLTAVGGQAAALESWECDQGIVGFTCGLPASALPVAGGDDLHKRQALRSVGYPSVIDHPAFSLAPRSLDPERYLPYLCPWLIDGHLALFTADDGWLTGRFYDGMNGSPVCNGDGQVVGMVLGGQPSPDHPPLIRFRRLN